jgi:indolepyruvate ferredoxin oxidoreductase
MDAQAPTVDERFTQEDGYEVFNGNELIVKGALEAGIPIASGYMGSPVAEFFTFSENYKGWLSAHGFYWEAAKNEAEGAARLNGARVAGKDAMAVMKSVGLNVAADPLEISNYQAAATVGWGGLVVVGDDPHASSTQVASSSRYLLRKLRMPIVEPSTPQEVKDFVGAALELSRSSQLIVGYVVQTFQADGIGSVELYQNNYPPKDKVRIDIERIDVLKGTSLPPISGEHEKDIITRRLPLALKQSREKNLNRILYRDPEWSHGRKIGFVASGLAYNYLEQAIHVLGMDERFPILKLGMIHPLDQDVVKSFAKIVDTIYVVEEKEPFVESDVSYILKNAYQNKEIDRVEIWGKTFPDGKEGFPEFGGFDPTLTTEKVGGAILRLQTLSR